MIGDYKGNGESGIGWRSVSMFLQKISKARTTRVTLVSGVKAAHLAEEKLAGKPFIFA